jgi:hypothetical protein
LFTEFVVNTRLILSNFKILPHKELFLILFSLSSEAVNWYVLVPINISLLRSFAF